MTNDQFRAAEKAAHKAGEKTLRYYIESKHNFSIEYMAMGVVQDAIRTFYKTLDLKIEN